LAYFDEMPIGITHVTADFRPPVDGRRQERGTFSRPFVVHLLNISNTDVQESTHLIGISRHIEDHLRFVLGGSASFIDDDPTVGQFDNRRPTFHHRHTPKNTCIKLLRSSNISRNNKMSENDPLRSRELHVCHDLISCREIGTLLLQTTCKLQTLAPHMNRPAFSVVVRSCQRRVTQLVGGERFDARSTGDLLRRVPNGYRSDSLLVERLPSGTVDPPTRIEIEGGTQMLQRFSARELRAACPCATCREPEGAQRVAVFLSGPIEVEIGDAKLVGSYGINLTFRPDGHRTGIFSFNYLWSLQAGE